MQRWLHDEEGATATAFVVSLTALLALALLAVDGGFLFVSRRGQVADTDAGALAAANWLIENPCAASQSVAETAAETQATTLVAANDAGTAIEPGGFDVAWDAASTACSPSGVVTVTTRRNSSLFFAPIFGYSNLTTGVETRVRFGQLSGVGGVRPLGFCSSDPHYQEWRDYLAARDAGDTVAMAVYTSLPVTAPLDHPNVLEYPLAANVVHRIEIEPVSTSSCAVDGGNGNWGWVDFDGVGGAGGAGSAEFKDRILNGYPPGVDLGDAGTGDNDCDAADPDFDVDCPGRPGAGGGSFKSQLNAITCTLATDACEPLFAVVYDQTTLSGSNVEYRLVGLVQFLLRGHSGSFTGNPAPGDYLDIEFVQERTTGSVGTPDPNSLAPPDTDLCGTGTADNC